MSEVHGVSAERPGGSGQDKDAAAAVASPS